jgi:uncharacterized DUF497 family protein
MDLEWDAAKDAENRRKHGLSLADAARLDWSASPVVPDLRHCDARRAAPRLRLHLAERPKAHHFVEKGQSS